MSLGYVILVLVLYLLTAARLTQLVNADVILDPMRVRLIRQMNKHRRLAAEMQPDIGKETLYEHHRALMFRWEKLAYFVGCPWCVGLWIALAVAFVPVHLIGWPLWAVLPVGLAASHLIGLGAGIADTEQVNVVEDR